MSKSAQRAAFAPLIQSGFPVVDMRPRTGQPRSSREHNEKVYAGPMRIPDDVMALANDPTVGVIHHATGKRPVLCLDQATEEFGLVKWRFFAPIPDNHLMMGEIVRVEDGSYRIHLHKEAEARRTFYTFPLSIVRKRLKEVDSPVPPEHRVAKIMPPLMPPSAPAGSARSRLPSVPARLAAEEDEC